MEDDFVERLGNMITANDLEDLTSDTVLLIDENWSEYTDDEKKRFFLTAVRSGLKALNEKERWEKRYHILRIENDRAVQLIRSRLEQKIEDTVKDAVYNAFRLYKEDVSHDGDNLPLPGTYMLAPE